MANMYMFDSLGIVTQLHMTNTMNVCTQSFSFTLIWPQVFKNTLATHSPNKYKSNQILL
jgi:hypothetical protein